MKKRLSVLLTTLIMLTALTLTVGCNSLRDDSSNGSGDNTGNGTTQEHTHTFATDWSNDGEYHWYDATCEHNVTDKKAKHTFDENNMCSVCKYYATDGFIFELNSDNSAYTIKGLEEGANKTQLVIPSVYNGKPVTAIEKNAFKDCDNLTSVRISPNINSIGAFAFDGCTGLNGVYITDLSSWCNIDFKGTASNPLECAQKLYLNDVLVTRLEIPADITLLDSYAFYNCNDISELSVSTDNTVYKSENNCIIEKETNRLVFGCKNSVIPEYVTAIGTSAFESCKGLKSIVIPQSVKSLGFNAFKNCTTLTSVEMPSEMTSILDDAFKNCSSLKSISIPKGIISIRNGVFSGCSSLTNIDIPEGITEIHSLAFAFCRSLTRITLPSSITDIQSFAFVDCRALTIYCEAVDKPIYGNWDSSWNSSCPVVWDYKNNDIADDGSIYYVADNGLRYALKDGIAELTNQPDNISGEKIISTDINYKGANYNVTGIKSEAFRSCKKLTGIIIPLSITNIDSKAFVYCDNLTIYCEIQSKPNSWSLWWNEDSLPVIWGYIG